MERRGIAKGFAIVHSTSKPGAPALSVQTKILPLQLPVRSDPLPLTSDSGMAPLEKLSGADAARRVGLDPSKDKYLTFYREPFKSWFFVRADHTAVALRLEFPQTAPQAVWRTRPLPKMDTTAPNNFGPLNGNMTEMLLRPDAFGGLVKVNTPTTRMYYDPGATKVTPEELWAILDRARERNIELCLVTFDPNRLGVVRLLSAVVTVDNTARSTNRPSKNKSN